MKSLIPVFGLSIFVLSGCGGQDSGSAPVPESRSDVEEGSSPSSHSATSPEEITDSNRQRELDEETRRQAEKAAAKQAEADRLAKEAADAAEADRLAQEEAAAKQAEMQRILKEEADRLKARPEFKLTDAEKIAGYKVLTDDEFASIDDYNLETGSELFNCKLEDFDDRHVIITEGRQRGLAWKGPAKILPIEFLIETTIAKYDFSPAAIAASWAGKNTISKTITKNYFCTKVE